MRNAGHVHSGHYLQNEVRMAFDYTDSIDKLKNMSTYDLIGIIAAHNEPTIVLHARHIYEERQRNEQRKYDNEQIELKHKRDKENIEYQHSLNKQILERQFALMKQQLKTMWRTSLITAAATFIAATAAVFLAYALTQIQKPLQIKIDSEQFHQLRTESSRAENLSVQKRDKAQTYAPSKIK
jgi:hypothetical protein